MRCGNCNLSFSTKKEWLDHLADVHKSYFLDDSAEGKYHKKILEEKANKGDMSARQILESVI